MTEPRHLRAGVIGLGVVDPAVGVALHVGTVAPRLAEAAPAGAARAEGRLLRRELVAVVAAAAGRISRLVGPLQAAPVLRDSLSALPVADQAPGGEADGGELLRL